MQHDLAHYAVETTLGWTNGFYRLLAGGLDIADFNVSGVVQRLNLHDMDPVEPVVGMLQVELYNQEEYADFAAQFRHQCDARGTPVPAQVADLTPDCVAQMRAALRELLARWERLPLGDCLELPFPVQ